MSPYIKVPQVVYVVVDEDGFVYNVFLTQAAAEKESWDHARCRVEEVEFVAK